MLLNSTLDLIVILVVLTIVVVAVLLKTLFGKNSSKKSFKTNSGKSGPIKDSEIREFVKKGMRE